MVVYVFPFFLDCSMMGLRQALSKRVLQGAKVPQTRLTIFTWLDSFAVLTVNVFYPCPGHSGSNTVAWLRNHTQHPVARTSPSRRREVNS
jgi:hypothetical protein